MAPSTRRIAITLPAAFLADLAYVSYRLGVPKSAVVSGILTGPLASMRSVLCQFPDPLDRLEADSREELFARLSELVGVAVQDGQELQAELLQGKGVSDD